MEFRFKPLELVATLSPVMWPRSCYGYTAESWLNEVEGTTQQETSTHNIAYGSKHVYTLSEEIARHEANSMIASAVDLGRVTLDYYI